MEFSEEFDPTTQTWTIKKLCGRKGHKRLEPWVRAQRSNLCNAGDGVFAERDFKKGALLGYYTGAVCPSDASLYGGAYAMGIAKSEAVIDGARCGSWTRKINDGKELTRANVRFVEDNFELRARRDIVKGEELFVEYGSDYWDTH